MTDQPTTTERRRQDAWNYEWMLGCYADADAHDAAANTAADDGDHTLAARHRQLETERLREGDKISADIDRWIAGHDHQKADR